MDSLLQRVDNEIRFSGGGRLADGAGMLQFVAWKLADEAFLEDQLSEAAVALAQSAHDKFIAHPDLAQENVAAIRTQMAADTALLRARVSALTGEPGVARFEVGFPWPESWL